MQYVAASNLTWLRSMTGRAQLLGIGNHCRQHLESVAFHQDEYITTSHPKIKEYGIKVPEIPKKTVRADVKKGGFYLEKIDENKTKIICVWNVDAKLYVPPKIINWFTGVFAC